MHSQLDSRTCSCSGAPLFEAEGRQPQRQNRLDNVGPGLFVYTAHANGIVSVGQGEAQLRSTRWLVNAYRPESKAFPRMAL